jgi:predicted NBD/HSP70 family sugar kinase
MSISKLKIILDNSETIKSLYYKKLLTSADVSSYTGKSIPHATKILNLLKKSGIVEEKGLADSSGGRKPLNYSLLPGSFNLLSVAMDQFSIEMVVVDLNNGFASEIARFEIDINTLQPAALVHYIEGFISKVNITKPSLLGIGLTMPGFVNTEKGINYTYMNMADQSLMVFLQKSLAVPVFLDNDSTAIALAEQKFGIAANEKDVMVVNLGWGIGLGMILNDQIFRGSNGLAGEFSHIPLFKNGRLCTCGKHGCLETEASLIAVAKTAERGILKGEATSLRQYETVDADAIINEAIKGDRFSVKLISEAAYHVGEGLAILIHLMNPGTIILSGKGAVVGRLWLAPIQQALNEHCIPMLTKFTKIELSKLNTRAQLVGGAALVIENLGKILADRFNAITDSMLEKVT